MDNKMKKLSFLLLALFGLNIVGQGLYAESSIYDQQITEINRIYAERQANIDRAIQAERAEQKRREENQRQRELAPSRAIESCNYGDMNMCFLVGNGYKNGAYTINNINAWFGYDDFKAVQFFTKACNGGNAKGCGALGTMYNEGKGTPQNKDKAAQLFIKACNANEASACNNLGTMYQNGYGMWGNKSKAKELYSKACQLRSQSGCTNYANLNK